MSSTLICDEGSEARDDPGKPPAPDPQGSDERYLRAQRLESIGMLASGIAHDLNNVLSPIILAAPVLREHATNPDDLRIITSLEKSAERGVDLVRQILSFAHGAASVPQTVQIKHLLRETLAFTRETFPRNISVEYGFPDNLWPIMADPRDCATTGSWSPRWQGRDRSSPTGMPIPTSRPSPRPTLSGSCAITPSSTATSALRS